MPAPHVPPRSKARRLLASALLAAACLPPIFPARPIAYAADPLFETSRPFGTVEMTTLGVAVGDVDGDGDLDLVAANSNHQNMLYLNDGAGDFQSARAFGSDSEPSRSVAVGDLNDDGSLDVVLGENGGQAAAYLNDGAGNFPTRRNFGGSADFITSVAVGDIDDDGDIDIITAYDGSPNVIYLNDGAGSFPTQRTFGAAAGLKISVAAGDLNGDGYLDLVVGDNGGQNQAYLNNGAGQFATARNFGTGTDATDSVALGDIDGDGDLDIIATNFDQPNVIYLNNGSGSFTAGNSFGTTMDHIQSLAAGDVDADGDLDIVAGNYERQNAVYLNDGAGGFSTSRSFGTGTDSTQGVAAADLDADGDLDLVAANEDQQSAIYLNSGDGAFAGVRTFGAVADNTSGIATADLDGDGDLDLAACALNQPGTLYLNDGSGNFSTRRSFGAAAAAIATGNVDGDDDIDIVADNTVYLNDGTGHFPAQHTFGAPAGSVGGIAVGDLDGDGDLDLVVAYQQPQIEAVYLNDGTGAFPTRRVVVTETNVNIALSLALGDLDGDGDLDIVTGRNSGQSMVYLNDGAGRFPTSRNFGGGAANTVSVATGDLNGDGSLDLVAGNSTPFGTQSAIYLNDGAAGFPTSRNFGSGADKVADLDIGDVDGDGDLDIAVGKFGQPNMVYLNDGAGAFPSGHVFGDVGSVAGVALADVDGDGDLDPIGAISQQPGVVNLNGLSRGARLPNNPPSIAIDRPGATANGAGFSSPEIIGANIIPISYRLADREGDRVRFIRAFYSLDGGGTWRTALATAGTPTTNLDTNHAYKFNWDTMASGLFGESDSVVFRIEAYTSLRPHTGSAPDRFQRPYQAAQTFPFRVRGTQVRVLRSGQPVAGALVYRLPEGQSRGGQPFANSAGQPYRTDPQGYLSGHGAMAMRDQLAALLPVRSGNHYTVYYTSAAPTASGLAMHTIAQTGVQTLSVSPATPLMLLNLRVSLEWDARKEIALITQLKSDLARASEFLYDWSNGQVALGQIALYQDREHWSDADIRIYATNRLRPNATQGGIAAGPQTDPADPNIRYGPGQVQIGAVWNRYGEPSGVIGEDWPRTLAHELGHYALFLDDDYLGLDPTDLLIPVDGCASAMNDPYRDDNSEFHPDADWLPACQPTLANRLTGRSDWSTIARFYPELHKPATGFAQINPGPSLLPLAVTQVQVVAPAGPSTVLDVPTFSLLNPDMSPYQPSAAARAFLFHQDRVTNLGSPTEDQLIAHGARPGDELCLYDLGSRHLGCATASADNHQLTIGEAPGWNPEVRVTPVTSRTIGVEVADLPSVPGLRAQLFPVDSPASPIINLTAAAGKYSGTFNLAVPALVGYVRVWVEEAALPRREVIADYALGGSPGRIKATWAPALSADGQVILFGRNLVFDPGDIVTLQATTHIPAPPALATVVGQGYRLAVSSGAPSLAGVSVSFNYLGSEVPLGREGWLRVFFWNGTSWRELYTALDTRHNFASAHSQGPGLYVLMSSIRIALPAIQR